MIISIIAAMDQNRLIGNKNSLPWYLLSDLQHFKRTTLGKPVLMGRKTFESIGRPLPGRTNIVLTRNSGFKADGVLSAGDFDAALLAADSAQELMVIGGAELYRQALPLAERLYLTEVEAEFEGDTWFPDYDSTLWREVERRSVDADDSNPYRHHFLSYERL